MSEAVSEKKQRPQFRNIHVSEIVKYRLPPSGIVSILHRISGAGLFLGLPFLLFLFEKSITSEISFYHFKGIAEQPLVKLLILFFSWAYLHHFCAGVRHLFMDMHVAIEKQSARKTAVSVLAVSLLLTAGVAYKLFGAN
ncbi:succinate dehydrogenase, cytochrome b556 subunit [Massilia sp. TS11]|uniref:succinate dehydrogenase, cytochrome b556 subunit n=1 Tax=Massilia sp. TS11 TaxID=2908003 RepID=UPI001EDC1788|nr:succinate dehydrogenase, cytochrome b556 subunit [Massilia sp. TS11]MCG2583097.1 succinate dehydrogenase, cytochrome b556 subunit [Massilia sp. TS11]